MISIVFSTFNGDRTLPTMLEALCKLRTPLADFEIIAVNNGSTDSTLELLEGYGSRLPLTVLQQPARGKNRALNLGVSNAKGDLIVLTDDDIVPDPNWLIVLEECAARQKDASLFGGAILPHWELKPATWLLDSVPLGITFALTACELQDGPIFPGLIWGPNMMVRRTVFDAGHRFNEMVGPSSGQYIMGSETEFNLRIAKHGFKPWFCSTAKVGHIIRDFQMSKEWVIRRAYRYGRNKCLQDYATGAAHESSLFGFANFPKWMLRSVLQNTLSGHLAHLKGDEARSVALLWDAGFYRGYIFQAQQLKRSKQDTPVSANGA